MQAVGPQQAPVTHGLGVQVVPLPAKTEGAVQADCVVTLHVVPLQQAPIGHGFGVQLVPSPW